MRHANASITMERYVQAVTSAKREAQSRLVQAIPFPDVTRKWELFANVPHAVDGMTCPPSSVQG
jgi:hypothetical protein